MPPTHRRTFALRQAGPTLIRGEGFADLFRQFLAAFPAESKNECFLGGAHSGQHPRHHLHHPHPWRTLMRMMPVMRGMLGCCPLSRANFAENVQPENLKILKWMENGWKMAWIEISKS